MRCARLAIAQGKAHLALIINFALSVSSRNLAKRQVKHAQRGAAVARQDGRCRCGTYHLAMHDARVAAADAGVLQEYFGAAGLGELPRRKPEFGARRVAAIHLDLQRGDLVLQRNDLDLVVVEDGLHHLTQIGESQTASAKIGVAAHAGGDCSKGRVDIVNQVADCGVRVGVGLQHGHRNRRGLVENQREARVGAKSAVGREGNGFGRGVHGHRLKAEYRCHGIAAAVDGQFECIDWHTADKLQPVVLAVKLGRDGLPDVGIAHRGKNAAGGDRPGIEHGLHLSAQLVIALGRVGVRIVGKRRYTRQREGIFFAIKSKTEGRVRPAKYIKRQQLGRGARSSRGDGGGVSPARPQGKGIEAAQVEADGGLKACLAGDFQRGRGGEG